MALLYRPEEAPEGANIGMSKVQLSPGASSPPLNVKEVVPDNAELGPQGDEG